MKLKNIIRKNKKGSVLDLFFITIIVLSLGVFFIITNFVFHKINDRLLNSTINESSLAVAVLHQSNNITDTSYNYIFLVLFIGFVLGILISSAMINVYKIFIPIYIIFFAIAIIIGVIMSYTYEQFKNNAILSSAASHMTFANAVIENYVLILVAVGVLSLILIFGKIGGERL